MKKVILSIALLVSFSAHAGLFLSESVDPEEDPLGLFLAED